MMYKGKCNDLCPAKDDSEDEEPGRFHELSCVRCADCGGTLDLMKDENTALFDEHGKPHVFTIRNFFCDNCGAHYGGSVWFPWINNPPHRPQDLAPCGILNIDQEEPKEDEDDPHVH